MSQGEARKMYDLICRSLDQYADSIKKLKKTIIEKKDVDEWSFNSDTLKMLEGDLKANLDNCEHLSNDIKDKIDSYTNHTQLPSIISSNKDIIRLSLESYITNLEEIKSKIRHKLGCTDIKLENIETEISFVNQVKHKFC